jgi:PQQ-dependent dehydrogenase (methanol/ethanol family)
MNFEKLVSLKVAVLLCPALTLGQNLTPSAAPSIEEGRATFVAHCAGCHGTDAHGTDRAPALAGNRRTRALSIEELRSIIEHGIPASGMPAFELAHQQLQAVTSFVHSLNSAAADTVLPGDPGAGERIFFGAHNCGSCHMVKGKGAFIGPDLSSLGRQMTVNEIRDKLLHPDQHVTPGYELVTVRLRNGETVRGFARGRSNFDLQLQDFEGGFHLFERSDVAAIEDEKRSMMKPAGLNPKELQDLIAYLGRLTGVQEGALEPAGADQSPQLQKAEFARIKDPHSGDWLTYNGKLGGNRYSELASINRSNIGKLGLKWIFPISHFGLEATPIVVDGVMYLTGPNEAFALDAAAGRAIWHYSRPRTQGLVGDASLGTNRGVAVLNDKIFMVTDNAHLIALNRVTGALVWDVVMPEEAQHYGSTIAPLVVKDTVIAGVSGGDWGIRGFIACFKASTGERIWRRWTVPAKGEPGYDTWKGSEPRFGGGSTWLTGTYDPGTDTLYWPTGNPFPDSDDRDRPGDNLFTNCVLALNPGTGALKWHYQFTPHDVRDRDATEPLVLVDTQYRGRARKLLLHADRNGFFYILDRTDGEILLAKKFLRRINWATGIGQDGRPQVVPEEKSSAGTESGCPKDATNWNATAFSPVTRFYYVMTLEECGTSVSGRSYNTADRKDEPGQKYLRAIDIDTGKIAWEISQGGLVLAKTWPGVLATAGGLVFYGDPNGAFVAADERTGKTLWYFATNVLMKASPMTFTAKDKQFIAVAAGPNILCFGLP